MKSCTRLITIIGIACIILTSASAYGAEDGRQQAMKKLFADAKRLFDNEAFDEAAMKFEELLKLDPNSEDALMLRDLADVRFYSQAMSKGTPEMQERVIKLLELAAEAEKARLTDPARIEELIKRLAGTEEERPRVYLELVSAGRYAVQPLLKRLADVNASNYIDYRVYASITLMKIGEEAVIPLCTALRTKEIPVRQDICFILGRIGDPRSVPYLITVSKSDPEEAVRRIAQNALDKIGEYAEIPDIEPRAALYGLARLYYYDHPSVQRSSRFGHSIWTWSEKDQLPIMTVVPDFLYNVGMSRAILVEALASAPDQEAIIPLLISSYHKELWLIQRRLELASKPEYKLNDAEERDLLARQERSQAVLMALRSAGEKHFYRALELQLYDRNAAVAAAIIGDLALVADPSLNVYPRLPAMYESLRPTVVQPFKQIDPAVAAAKKAKKAAEEQPVAEPVAKKREAGVRAEALFVKRFEAEAKLAYETPVRVAPTPTPKGREALNQIIVKAQGIAQQKKDRITAELEREIAVKKEIKDATVDNPLVLALLSQDKIVRYSAASALVQLNPDKNFNASRTVVEVLGQAIAEKGFANVLVVSNNQQSANKLNDLVRQAEHLVSTADTTESAIRAARSIPPRDLIAVDGDMPETVKELRKDPIIAAVPMVIFTLDDDTEVISQTFSKEATGFFSLGWTGDKIIQNISSAMFGKKDPGEGMSNAAKFARMGAEAIAKIPENGSPYSQHLIAIKEPLIAAFDADDPQVRASAIVAVGKSRNQDLIPRLAMMAGEKERAMPERHACIEAIGLILEPGKETPQEVVQLVQAIHQSGDKDLRKFVVEKLSNAVIPTSGIEQLILQQETVQMPEPVRPEKKPEQPKEQPEVKPEEPAQPAEEVKPEEPAQPVEEVKPEEPAQPAEEVKPEEPAQPAEEVKPEEPAQPAEEVKPEEPAQPAEEVKPEEPAQPAEEVKPEEPAQPAEEVKPEEPAQPAEEVKPEEPAQPAEEVKPEEPAKPAEEVKPEEPAQPAEEVKPEEPAKPAEEVKPIEPAKPAEEPVKPAEEVKPVEKPAEPAAPEEPKEPEAPQAPEENQPEKKFDPNDF